MPTYDYECEDCKHTFEKFQTITAAPLRKCPRCNGRLRRLIGAGAGVIFKGSGFYETDYRKNRAACSSCDKAESCPKSSGNTPDGAGRKKPSEKHKD